MTRNRILAGVGAALGLAVVAGALSPEMAEQLWQAAVDLIPQTME